MGRVGGRNCWQRSLQVYVANLRLGLQLVSFSSNDGNRSLSWDGYGYRLQLHDGDVDVSCFRRLVEEGRRAAAEGNGAGALDCLRTAARYVADGAFRELADCSMVKPTSPRSSSCESAHSKT